MRKKLTQQQRSALALVLTGLFLLTGKLFVWKSDKPVTAQPDTPPSAEVIAPAETTAPELAETLPFSVPDSGTDVTVLVPIEPHTEDAETETEPLLTEPETDAAATEAVPETTAASVTSAPETAVQTETTAAQTEAVPENDASSDYFNDALFIGDSRTVGMADYAPIDGATYFASVGLSTYNIDAKASEVPGTKGQMFSQVLAAGQYGKVYIMLGINELGNNFDSTMQHYRDLIARVQQAQPNAIVILQANLHVAYSRSSTDAVVNNTVINRFNDAVAAMADGRKIYYLDANPVFDDANGCLAAELTSDGTHPYAKHYLTWADWLRNHIIPV